MKILIANYSLGKVALPMLICFGIVAFVLIETFGFGVRPIIDRLDTPGKKLWLPVLYLTWLGGMATFLLVLTQLKRILFDAASAIWIEDGRLIFLHRWVLCVECDKIIEARCNRFGRFNKEGIIVQMRNGTERGFPTGALSEPCQTVLSRLRQALNLSST